MTRAKRAKANNGLCDDATFGVSKKVYGPIMASAFALEKVELKGKERPTFTEAHRVHGTFVVKTSRHVVASKDGKLQDTWDCRGYYWQVYGEHYNKQFRERKAMTIWVPQAKLFEQLLSGIATAEEGT